MPSPASRSRTHRAPDSERFTVGGRPIELALGLLIVAGFGLAGALLDVLSAAGVSVPGRTATPARSLGATVFAALLTLLFLLGICFLAWRGANWARILIVVLAVVSFLVGAYGVVTRGFPVVPTLTTALTVVVAVLLCVPRVNAWMRKQA